MSRKSAAGPFCQFPPNARFNTFIGEDWVSITLRPGEVLHHWTGGPTEEGFTSRAMCWDYDQFDLTVTESLADSSRDCDGPLDFYAKHVCPVADLRALPAEPADDEWQVPELPARPDWSEPSRSQRDHYAEAAGY